MARCSRGVSAKDIILALIARIGVGGGTGSVFEYTGSAIRALGMEERMTVCNMSIEGGARAGLVAPDDTTFQYLDGRPHAPQGAAWDAALARWKQLPTDEGAVYDRTRDHRRRCARADDHLRHQPRHGRADHARRCPNPSQVADPMARDSIAKALALHGPRRRQAAAGPSHRRGLHRKLHQFAHLRSAHRGRRC